MKKLIPLLFLSGLMALEIQVPEDRNVSVIGRVFYEASGKAYVVKQCTVRVKGPDEVLLHYTDDDGRFSVPIVLTRDIQSFKIQLNFEFSRRVTPTTIARALSIVNPSAIKDSVYDLGNIYLIEEKHKQRVWTIWDLLEDSLRTLANQKQSVINDLNQLQLKLNVVQKHNDDYLNKLKSLQDQNTDYVSQIEDLTKQNSDFEAELNRLRDELKKQKVPKKLFDNFYLNEYLDLIQTRDSLLAVLDDSVAVMKPGIQNLDLLLKQRDFFFLRLDLFAKNVGQKDTNVISYKDMIPARDSVLIKQSLLMATSPFGEHQRNLYKSLIAKRNSILDKQDSLVFSLLTGFNAYRYHLVVPGDHLWNIAINAPEFKNPYSWRILYIVNKDQIANPDSIFPGQILKIPIRKEKAETDKP